MVSSVRAYLLFLGLIALERAFELRLSRRNARIAFSKGGREYGGGHFPTMALFHGALLFSCAAEVIFFHRRLFGPLAALALIGALSAQALRYWAIATLGARWNVRIIVVPGEEPITSGPYRFIRHPNYLAVILELASLPLAGGAVVTALAASALNALVLARRIPLEERELAADPAWRAAMLPRPRLLPWLGSA